MAMQKILDKVEKSITFSQVNNILNTCNKLSIMSVHNLLINSSILIY